MKHAIKVVLFSIYFLCGIQVALAQPSPVNMLQNATDQMLNALEKTTNKNPKALYGLVQRILLPHVDLDNMSQQILGNAWQNASPAQKTAFKQEFTYFVTRTYSTALASYSNQKVRYLPIRGGVKGDHVQVNSLIDQNSGQSIAVNYRLSLSGGEWKVYDFSVEGVSIVNNYRSQFSSVLRTKGLDGLIAQLKSHNAGM
ncbi:MAG: mlaC [Gammaproteobacteria bacterium]|jgi:phospholipid transport system substrate-binding protein|nr:mlaC [Gammaproteobacteria bacterium]